MMRFTFLAAAGVSRSAVRWGWWWRKLASIGIRMEPEGEGLEEE